MNKQKPIQAFNARPVPMTPEERTCIQLDVEFTFSILKAGIAQTFIDYFTCEEKLRTGVDSPEWDPNGEFYWYEASRADDAGPFDFDQCRVFHCDLLLFATLRRDNMRRCASDLLLVHVYPNMPLRDASMYIPRLLIELGVLDWYTDNGYINDAVAGISTLRERKQP
jgi:hypothetical protein